LNAIDAHPYAVLGFQNGYKIEIVEPQTPWKKDSIELAKRNVNKQTIFLYSC